MQGQPFPNLLIELAGACNAKCKWCSTGRANLQCAGGRKRSNMSKEMFCKVLDYITERGFVAPEASIEMFNYGEPFLNPELNEICMEAAKRGRRFFISTNGSVLTLLNPACLEYLDYLTVSMSGFTQKSYGRIHGFRLEKILMNIAAMAAHFEAAGYPGKIVMNYHVYQYNIDEIKLAKAFCDEHKIHLSPKIAYLADTDLFWRYRENTLPYDTLMEASKDLFLYKYDTLAEECPEDYRCPQYEKLLISENGEVVPCCLLDNSKHGKTIFEYASVEELRSFKESWPDCRRCYDTKTNYIVHQDMRFQYGYRRNDEGIMPARIYLDYGSGLCEENKLIGEAARNERMNTRFRLPEGVKQIRFDPVEYRGCVLRGLKIRSERGPLQVAWCNGDYVDGTYYFHTEDPQLLIEAFAEPCREITIEAQVEYFLNDREL